MTIDIYEGKDVANSSVVLLGDYNALLAEMAIFKDENERLKCCGNCENDIYCLSPICVQCTRGVQITTVSDKKDNWESK